MKEDMKGASVVVAIVSMVIGGLVGFAFGINDEGSTTTLITEGKSQIDSNASRLQNSLMHSFSEQISYTFQLMEETYNGQDSQGVIVAELDEVSESHAELIANTFEIEEADYLEMLRDMNSLYVDYATALKKGENESAQDIRSELDNLNELRVKHLTESTSNISGQDLSNEMQKLNLQLLEFIDNYDSTDYGVAYSKQREAHQQAKSITKRLTRAAIAEFPERYIIDNENNNED